MKLIPLRNGSFFDCFKVRTAWLSGVARSLKHKLHSGSNNDLQVNLAHLRNPNKVTVHTVDISILEYCVKIPCCSDDTILNKTLVVIGFLLGW